MSTKIVDGVHYDIYKNNRMTVDGFLHRHFNYDDIVLCCGDVLNEVGE
jgi:hypothetical protein